MRIRVSHRSVYEYAVPAKGLVQTLRLTPRNHDGQYVVHWRIDVDADARLKPGEDAFSNITHSLSLAGPLERLVVTVEGEVQTHDTAGVVRGSVERFPETLYLRDAPLALADEAVGALADEAAAMGGDRLGALHALMKAIHTRVAHQADPAAVSTDAPRCLAAGAGTAEDIAHLFIAAARRLGIPARYVSGYVAPGEHGAASGALHAWAEAAVDGLGWVGFDPVFDICPSVTHIRVAVGLDSLGAMPVRGARYGGSDERCDVTVKVLAQSQSQA